MTAPAYLTTPIAEAKRTARPRYGMTRGGYTTRRGAPTSILIRLQGETRFRRLMIWQFSNAGTAFVRIRGEALIVPDHAIPEVQQAAPPAVDVLEDEDGDPFFVCLGEGCGLRSWLSREPMLGEPIACAHCDMIHSATEVPI